jgi:hypothetical protein
MPSTVESFGSRRIEINANTQRERIPMVPLPPLGAVEIFLGSLLLGILPRIKTWIERNRLYPEQSLLYTFCEDKWIPVVL